MRIHTIRDDWDEEQLAGWEEWVSNRPESVQNNAKQYPAGIYRLKTTGKIGTIVSYEEDGTVTMRFPFEWNPQQILFGSRRVFGIDPQNLEEIASKITPDKGPQPIG